MNRGKTVPVTVETAAEKEDGPGQPATAAAAREQLLLAGAVHAPRRRDGCGDHRHRRRGRQRPRRRGAGDSGPMTTSRLWALAVHAGRVAVLVVIVLLIRAKHRDYLLAQRSDADHAPPLDKRAGDLPRRDGLRPSADAAAVWDVLDADKKQLGSVLQSSPDSDAIIGFSGPLEPARRHRSMGRIAGLAVLSSRDTPEHVGQVSRDPKFLHAFDGLHAAAGVWSEEGRRRLRGDAHQPRDGRGDPAAASAASRRRSSFPSRSPSKTSR